MRITTFIAAMAVGLALSAGTASAANSEPSSTPPSNCEGSYNPYTYTASALEACEIPVYPASVTELPNGGRLYSYYEPDGVLYAETAVPPASFDPISATADELAEYGYPPRPETSLSTQDEEWEKMVSVPRTTPESFMADVPHTFSASLSNSHWSGRITSEGGFSLAEANYTEPSFDNSQCESSADVTWAGLGGGPAATKSSSLFQTGTAHSNNLNIGLANHQPWWEIASGETETAAQPFASKTLARAGDGIGATADIQSRPGYVTFTVYDYTLQKSWQTSVPLNGRVANPATAEMITERPKVNGAYPHLSKFGTLVFSSNEAAQEGFSHYLSEFPTEGIFMRNAEEVLLANVSEIGKQGLFEVAWKHC